MASHPRNAQVLPPFVLGEPSQKKVIVKRESPGVKKPTSVPHTPQVDSVPTPTPTKSKASPSRNRLTTNSVTSFGVGGGGKMRKSQSSEETHPTPPQPPRPIGLPSTPETRTPQHQSHSRLSPTIEDNSDLTLSRMHPAISRTPTAPSASASVTSLPPQRRKSEPSPSLHIQAPEKLEAPPTRSESPVVISETRTTNEIKPLPSSEEKGLVPSLKTPQEYSHSNSHQKRLSPSPVTVPTSSIPAVVVATVPNTIPTSAPAPPDEQERSTIKPFQTDSVKAGRLHFTELSIVTNPESHPTPVVPSLARYNNYFSDLSIHSLNHSHPPPSRPPLSPWSSSRLLATQSSDCDSSVAPSTADETLEELTKVPVADRMNAKLAAKQFEALVSKMKTEPVRGASPIRERPLLSPKPSLNLPTPDVEVLPRSVN
jgi:hypothetical protein